MLKIKNNDINIHNTMYFFNELEIYINAKLE